ncbi:rRNA maturation RNase YbeY [Candidatus Marinamargulisbacteria bacterium SCGC AG-343-K17]|nr:rRNA maturation RNase YbeY [Candidatus Marinamargulisbacteria bacterium SCGC AG-343-K17]
MKNNAMIPNMEINNQQTTVDISLDIESYVITLCTHLGLQFDHLEITLLSKEAISKMNLEYFDLDTPTDTISFNLTPEAAITGDIYLCPDIILANATTYLSDFNEELKIVLIHSMLHLMGYTDDTPENYSHMKNTQEKIYQELSQ